MNKKVFVPIKILEFVRGNNDKGFALTELTIALAIFAIGMLAVATMQTTAIQGNTLSSGLTQAVVTYNQDTVERLLALGFNDSDLDAGPHSPQTLDRYATSWNVDLDEPYDGAKTITVTTRWRDQSGSHDVTMSIIKDSRLD